MKWPTYEQALGKWEDKTCFLTGRNDWHNRAQGRAAMSPDQFGVRGGRVQKTQLIKIIIKYKVEWKELSEKETLSGLWESSSCLGLWSGPDLTLTISLIKKEKFKPNLKTGECCN